MRAKYLLTPPPFGTIIWIFWHRTDIISSESEGSTRRTHISYEQNKQTAASKLDSGSRSGQRKRSVKHAMKELAWKRVNRLNQPHTMNNSEQQTRAIQIEQDIHRWNKEYHYDSVNTGRNKADRSRIQIHDVIDERKASRISVYDYDNSSILIGPIKSTYYQFTIQIQW